MGNKPSKHYNYNKPGVLMLTLQARDVCRLCVITPSSFTLTPIGACVKDALEAIPKTFPQIKIGHFQIMPDHLHVVVHMTAALPGGKTIRQAMAVFKVKALGLARDRHIAPADGRGLFETGLYDRIVADPAHLECETAYIRDNVRRLRRLREAPSDIREQTRVRVSIGGERREFPALGNLSLLKAPEILPVRFSRRMEEREWPEAMARLGAAVKRGAVFASPFLSPFEKRALAFILNAGGRVIHITRVFFRERYKPYGLFFDAFRRNRLLEISMAPGLGGYGPLDRDMCLKMNELAAALERRPGQPRAPRPS